jgi:hypothetical protein
MRVPQGLVFWSIAVLAVLFLIYVIAGAFMEPVLDGVGPRPPDLY